MTVEILEGDNRTHLRRMIDEGRTVDAVVTDPPYGLVSIQKRFGSRTAAAARTEGNDGSFARLSGGFMGKSWDATEIERDPEFWGLIYGVLKPGGFVFAFSGARTGHWQACAMEQAGFIMHPMHAWLYGQGFPKAHAADKAIDKALGEKGQIVPSGEPVKRMIPGAQQHRDGSWIKTDERSYQPGEYLPATEQAAQWRGWAYGTQTQKPALEPIYLAQKPFSEKSGALNLMEHGVGALNIDGCRGESDDGGKGRHPANVLHDGSEEVEALFPNDESRYFNAFPDIPPAFYHGKANKEDRAGSKHPTVKPIGLLRHLIRHVAPKGSVILDPFAGSGTTGEAAIAEDMHALLMEQDPDYVKFLEERFTSKLTSAQNAGISTPANEEFEDLLSDISDEASERQISVLPGDGQFLDLMEDWA